MSFARQIRLPHTDLVVGRVGLGSSIGIGPDGLELALDHGINMFTWDSVRRGAEREIFPQLAEHPNRPGVFAYTATRWARRVGDPVYGRTRLAELSD